MAQMLEIEVWVLVDENGEYSVSKSSDDLVDAYETAVGALADAGATRRVMVTLRVPCPETVGLVGTVPAEGEANLTVQE